MPRNKIVWDKGGDEVKGRKGNNWRETHRKNEKMGKHRRHDNLNNTVKLQHLKSDQYDDVGNGTKFDSKKKLRLNSGLLKGLKGLVESDRKLPKKSKEKIKEKKTDKVRGKSQRNISGSSSSSSSNSDSDSLSEILEELRMIKS